MTFDDLLAVLDSPNRPNICANSANVKKGDIFIAIKGTTHDGCDFIGSAIQGGAKYVLCREQKAPLSIENQSCEFVIVDNPANAAAKLAQASCQYPAEKLTNLAVTGTNGKTTVAFLVRSVINNALQKCGLIGTICFVTTIESDDAVLTTPDCLLIAELQQKMVKAGVKYMIIEASSHALSQNRLDEIEFEAAAFTNLTGDHLDYHQNKQNYLDAKTALFAALGPRATAVLNRQCPESDYIASKTKAHILWYAIDAPADLTAQVQSMDTSGTIFSLQYLRSRAIVRTPLLGRHNVSNHLAAAGLCLAAGFDLQTIAAGLSELKSIPGRLEKLDTKTDFSILIDYAHTDDALKNVLSTLKPLAKAKLTVVFGCGGDRDRTKRPRMAHAAEQLADCIIVTSDNPRTENPEEIIEEIVAGFENPDSSKITVEPDRRRAIQLAIESAQKDDILLIAGKGHETYQIIGTKKIDFSDKLVALECLANKK